MRSRAPKRAAHLERADPYASGMSSDRRQLFRFWRDGYQALSGLHRLVADSGLEASLLELVRMRASQINGCAYCIDMHAKDARRGGETEQRLYALDAWCESPFFTQRERAALALTEAVTLISTAHRSEDVIEAASSQFPPEQLSHLLYAIIEINSWNRLAITTGSPQPGSYVPPEGGSGRSE